ncbi:uncharacterized protein PFL1_06195 [Pseudozyma flocculosa PF-1]|uniref:FHA domain-containing protein n=2 Tax=Pseudozyma flocculosa TaxID=84751 RepID=A0A5C3FA00_9BASI|nr:uncharacterized protein PFL1_06195 [Pseudozyma flocculosa PF-1]EPQ26260.1 hypothetical protein PFL1_06195 [Pseudozyma flocculosa PF-1]SPO40221.1 uncharacterized protein PSFLO_05703 [Pseudozyma flocculosa]
MSGLTAISSALPASHTALVPHAIPKAVAFEPIASVELHCSEQPSRAWQSRGHKIVNFPAGRDILIKRGSKPDPPHSIINEFDQVRRFPSKVISKEHACITWRTGPDGAKRPYLLDLASTHGTIVERRAAVYDARRKRWTPGSGIVSCKVPQHRPFELQEGDCVTFGKKVESAGESFWPVIGYVHLRLDKEAAGGKDEDVLFIGSRPASLSGRFSLNAIDVDSLSEGGHDDSGVELSETEPQKPEKRDEAPLSAAAAKHHHADEDATTRDLTEPKAVPAEGLEQTSSAAIDQQQSPLPANKDVAPSASAKEDRKAPSLDAIAGSTREEPRHEDSEHQDEDRRGDAARGDDEDACLCKICRATASTKSGQVEMERCELDPEASDLEEGGDMSAGAEKTSEVDRAANGLDALVQGRDASEEPRPEKRDEIQDEDEEMASVEIEHHYGDEDKSGESEEDTSEDEDEDEDENEGEDNEEVGDSEGEETLGFDHPVSDDVEGGSQDGEGDMDASGEAHLDNDHRDMETAVVETCDDEDCDDEELDEEDLDEEDYGDEEIDEDEYDDEDLEDDFEDDYSQDGSDGQIDGEVEADNAAAVVKPGGDREGNPAANAAEAGAMAHAHALFEPKDDDAACSKESAAKANDAKPIVEVVVEVEKHRTRPAAFSRQTQTEAHEGDASVAMPRVIASNKRIRDVASSGATVTTVVAKAASGDEPTKEQAAAVQVEASIATAEAEEQPAGSKAGVGSAAQIAVETPSASSAPDTAESVVPVPVPVSVAVMDVGQSVAAASDQVVTTADAPHKKRRTAEDTALPIHLAEPVSDARGWRHSLKLMAVGAVAGGVGVMAGLVSIGRSAQ